MSSGSAVTSGAYAAGGASWPKREARAAGGQQDPLGVAGRGEGDDLAGIGEDDVGAQVGDLGGLVPGAGDEQPVGGQSLGEGDLDLGHGVGAGPEGDGHAGGEGGAGGPAQQALVGGGHAAGGGGGDHQPGRIRGARRAGRPCPR